MSNKERINRDKLIEEIHRLLSIAGIPRDAQLTYINQMVDNFRYDMNLKMDIMEYSVKFFMYERGKIIYENRIYDEQAIIYFVIENVAAVYSVAITERSSMPDGYIDLTDGKRIKDEVFTKIGEPYLTMYQNKIDVFSY